MSSLAVAVSLAACNKPSSSTSSVKLATDDAKAAYSIGYMTAKSMSAQVPALDTKSYAAGFKDAYAKKDPAIKEADMKTVLMAFEAKVRKEAEDKQKKDAAEAVTKGATYLAENAKKAGVTTTASGLQYQVIKEIGRAHV